MNDDDLRRALGAGESEVLELRRRLPRPNAFLRDVVAFANTKGGHLVVGVDEAGEPTGLDPEPAALAALVAYVREHIDPPLDVSVEALTLAGRRPVVVFGVPFGSDPPYTVAGTAESYVRRGAASVPVRADDLRRLAIEARIGGFEDAPVVGATVDDLEPARVAAYLARRRVGAPADAPPVDPEALLRNLGFLAATPAGERDIPTVAALLLFGRGPQRLFPQARVDVVRFAGDAPGPDADRATVEGTLPEQIDGALAVVGERMRVGVRVEGFGREDLPEYPPEVVRELLVNALVHRDYSLRGAAVQMRMFFDRWEVVSPGRLPGPLTPADLARGERLARNPRLAEALRTLGYGEALGLGLARVRALLGQAGYPPPEVREGAAAVTVVLTGAAEARRREERLRRYRNLLAHGDGHPRRLAALEHLLRHGTLTNAEYRRLTGVSDVTALRDLGNLVARGLLVRHGAKRGAYYTAADAAPAARSAP